jgi:hypothetical protein
MNRLSSRDGTTIAYDKQGEGPALILVDGALTVHSSGSGAELARLLAPHFTVDGFDRRGRGYSGDTLRARRPLVSASRRDFEGTVVVGRVG